MLVTSSWLGIFEMELMASVTDLSSEVKLVAEEESSSSVVVINVGEVIELMCRGGLSVSLVGWSS